MILPDVNLLVYAYNEEDREHEKAKKWLQKIFAGEELIALPWAIVNSFLRILSSRSIFKHPQELTFLVDIVEEWLSLECVRSIEPGSKYMGIFKSIAEDVGVGGNLISDLHLAALAIENNCIIHTNDSDFKRFSGVKWANPLE